MGDNLDSLYQKYDVLSAAKNVSEHSKEYQESIEGVRGNESDKMLAAQILSKFFKNFPALQDKALNALLDLCEDDEPKIRACAMRFLVQICKDVKEHVSKVTDILAQMMQLAEQRDFTTAAWCLLQLWKQDPINVLKTMFFHVQNLTTTLSRGKSIEFIFRRLIKPTENISTDVENVIVEESKKLLQEGLGADETLLVLSCLINLKYGKTVLGQKEILDIVAEILEFDTDLQEITQQSISRIIFCVTQILPLFSAKNESTRFVKYYCDQILPNWDKVAALPQGDLLQLKLIQQLAQSSLNCGTLENPSLHVVQIFDKLKNYMPPPPENMDVRTMPNLEFSVVECLLFAFHRLARQCPDFLTHDPEVLKDFRSRLVYFARGVQGCNKVMETTKLKDLDARTKPKVKIAPTILTNLTKLIRDLFYQPPVYKCVVELSFLQGEAERKQFKKPEESSRPQKRHAPITFDSESSPGSKPKPREGGNLKLYTPPSGKFSNNFQSYGGRRPRGGRGGRGGRGPVRSWRN